MIIIPDPQLPTPKPPPQDPAVLPKPENNPPESPDVVGHVYELSILGTYFGVAISNTYRYQQLRSIGGSPEQDLIRKFFETDDDPPYLRLKSITQHTMTWTCASAKNISIPGSTARVESLENATGGVVEDGLPAPFCFVYSIYGEEGNPKANSNSYISAVPDTFVNQAYIERAFLGPVQQYGNSLREMGPESTPDWQLVIDGDPSAAERRWIRAAEIDPQALIGRLISRKQPVC